MLYLLYTLYFQIPSSYIMSSQTFPFFLFLANLYLLHSSNKRTCVHQLAIPSCLRTYAVIFFSITELVLFTLELQISRITV